MFDIDQPLPPVLTVEELHEVLRIGRNAAYDLLARDEIYHVKIGRSIRIPRSAVERFLGQEPSE
jgi:excisionase family DNA binding protein